jgi:hypothetical protein
MIHNINIHAWNKFISMADFWNMFKLINDNNSQVK